MLYRPKPNLVTIMAAPLLLGLSSTGCYEALSVLTGVASNHSSNPIVGDVLDGASNLFEKKGDKEQYTREKYEDVDVELYRTRKTRELEDELNKTELGLDEETQKAWDEISGQKQGGIDQRALIKKLEETYEENPFDYERNVRAIDRTLNLEGLTSGDRNRLIELLKRGINARRSKKFIELRRAGLYNLEFINRECEGKMLICEYLISRPETSNRTKFLKLYHQDLKWHWRRAGFSEAGSITFAREKMDKIIKMKKQVQLSRKEEEILDAAFERVESSYLRAALKRQSPADYKNKKQKLEEAVKKHEASLKQGNTDSTKELIELAKEIGHLTWLKSQIK